MQKPLTSEEQEALFQALLRKLPSLAEPVKLEEAALLALALMLRRPTDRELKVELVARIREVVAEVKPGASPDALRNEMRFAARGCIKVLQAARERRLPRRATDNWAQAGAKPCHPLHPSPADEDAAQTRRGLRMWAVLVAVMIAAGLYAWWRGAGSQSGPDSAEAAKLVDQIVAAAQGGGPPSHVFGGPLKVQVMGGRVVVVAEQVPPRMCAAAGWSLVHKGVLTINGITPNRVSAGKITELCNSEDGDAALIWMPK